MPLLNYTTQVPASRSIAEIMEILQKGGATAILMENNGCHEIEAIHFRIKTGYFGELSYKLPANVDAVILAMNNSIKKGERDGSRKLKVPRALYNNKEQAKRIAWRIVKDWLEAQLAIHELGVAKLEQAMLPFQVDETGRTFYERLADRGTLALPAPDEANT